MISFGSAIGLFYKNYVNFKGRATRAEYWWPTLMQTVVYIVLIVAFFTAFESDKMETTDGVETGSFIVFIIGLIFYLVNFLPGLTVKVRRFHDLNQTGWLVLVFWAANFVVPLVEFARMIWFAFPGMAWSNQYGPDPHTNNADIFE